MERRGRIGIAFYLVRGVHRTHVRVDAMRFASENPSRAAVGVVRRPPIDLSHRRHGRKPRARPRRLVGAAGGRAVCAVAVLGGSPSVRRVSSAAPAPRAEDTR